MSFETKRLPVPRTEVAPDGSDVRVLLGIEGCLMAHYELAPDEVSTALTNRTIEEIWYILSGRGEMWRKQGDREEVIALESGVCLTIPLGTHFQFRSFAGEPLRAIGVTVPPWPGQGEAMAVEGKWAATVS